MKLKIYIVKSHICIECIDVALRELPQIYIDNISSHIYLSSPSIDLLPETDSPTRVQFYVKTYVLTSVTSVPDRGNSKYHYYGLRIKAGSSLLRLMEDQQHLAMRQQPFSQKQRYLLSYVTPLEPFLLNIYFHLTLIFYLSLTLYTVGHFKSSHGFRHLLHDKDRIAASFHFIIHRLCVDLNVSAALSHALNPCSCQVEACA